jgi:HEAT repeat protein
LPFLIATMTLTGTIEERRQAPVALGFIGPEAAPAVPVLALALSDSDPVFRCDAALALLLIGPDGGGAATTALAETLDGTQADVLCQVDSDSKRMIRIRKPIGYELLLDEILASSNQDKVSLQHLALYVLMSQGKDAAAAMPALVNALKEPSTRRLAAEALGQTGAAAHPFLGDILQPPSATPGQDEALSGLNNDLRRSAAYALLRSTANLEPAALEALTQIAQDQTEDPHVQSMVLAALSAQGRLLSNLHAGDEALVPVAASCPAWLEKDLSGVHLIGYDHYLDRCAYTEPAEAPSWKKVFKWLVSTWKRR